MNSGLVTLALVIASAATIVYVMIWAYRRGRESERLKEMERDNEAMRRVRDAEGGAPSSRDELLERLRNSGQL